MKQLSIGLCLGVVACGSSTTRSDASTDSCDLGRPFGTPSLVPGIATTSSHRHATLVADETQIVFAQFATSVPDDLYVAQRASRSDPFGAATALTALNTAATENGPSLGADGLTLYYNEEASGGAFSIYTATRASPSDAFGAGQPLAGANAFASQQNASPTADGQVIYYDANSSHLYRAVAANGFGSPDDITELASGAPIGSPVPTADDLGLYFTRFGATDFDIWLARRSSPSGPYTDIAPVPELNSANRDQPSWISPDGCRIYMFSDRGGDYQLYFAERQ